MMTEFRREELLRYSRHMALPEVGVAGQRRLQEARVLVIGAGGLGSPLSLYLAAAGIGHLGLIDGDVVDLSNLQRQILYTTEDVGRSKIEIARARLAAVNPHVEVETYPTRLTRDNAREILASYDLIADGSDNYPTRYLVNDASVLLRKPYVYGSIFRFEGQVSYFDATRGPCYRCLYPKPPAPGLVPNCEEGGVLGVLPGVIGTLQATETIKAILGQGNLLLGRLLLFDALQMRFQEIRIAKNRDCPICSEKSEIVDLVDYENLCAGVGASKSGVVDISPEELQRRIARKEPITLLDVREPHEYEICRIEGARLIPLAQITTRMGELNADETLVVYCHHGKRSRRAAEQLSEHGFKNVLNLSGGIDAWARIVDASLATY